MSANLTKSQQAIVAAVLAALQQPAPKPPVTKPKAKVTLDASHPVVQIAKAKTTLGKVVCDTPERIALARDLVGIKLPEGCTRFTLSIANKGWAFVGSVCSEVKVSKTHAAELRTLVPATRRAAP